MNDPIETAAKALTEDEARVLAHFANNENAGDIAITLEMDRNYVVSVIRHKGRDNRTYSKRVATMWQTRNKPSRPAGAMLTSDVIGAPRALPAVHAALRSGTPAAATAAKAVGRTVSAATAPRKATKVAAPAPPPAPAPAPEPAPEPVAEEQPPPVAEIEHPAQEEEADVQLAAETITRAEDLPLAAEHMSPDHNVFQCQHPDCRRDAEAAAADPVPMAAEPEEVPAAPTPAGPDAGETFEQLLDRAEKCSNGDVTLVAKNLRADLAALTEALDIVGRAALLEERIGVLDEQIAEKTSVRDKLRAELEELMGSGVMVSVASGHLRKPVAGDPDDATLRAWGTRNGFRIASVGKVPGAVLIAYRKAHGLAA